MISCCILTSFSLFIPFLQLTPSSLCVNGVPTFQKGAANPRDDPPKYVTKDMETCNGYINVLDQVLLDVPLPFDMEEAVAAQEEEEETSASEPTAAPIAATPPTTTATTATDCQSIAALACSLANFTTLCDLVETLDLTETLSNGTYTVFAPTDEAFDEAASALTLDDNNDDDQDNIATLLDIVLFHVVPDQALLLAAASDLPCTGLQVMANGESSRTVCDGDVVRKATYQKGAGNPADRKPKIVQADILACNGK
jgi:uncharacterized surface protein with fasciclin (FAS1) repeats